MFATLHFLLPDSKIWANAQISHHSISIISYAGCLGLSPAISAKIHSLSANVYRSVKSLKIHYKPLFGVQGRSRSSMLVLTDSSSAVLVIIRSKSVSICNHSRRGLSSHPVGGVLPPETNVLPPAGGPSTPPSGEEYLFCNCCSSSLSRFCGRWCCG